MPLPIYREGHSFFCPCRTGQAVGGMPIPHEQSNGKKLDTLPCKVRAAQKRRLRNCFYSNHLRRVADAIGQTIKVEKCPVLSKTVQFASLSPLHRVTPVRTRSALR